MKKIILTKRVISIALLVISIAIVISSIIAIYLKPVEKKLEKNLIVEQIDVGDGNSALVILDDFSMLIDTGNVKSYSLVVNTLKKYNIKKLDCLVLSNARKEYTGAGKKIIADYKPDKVYASYGLKGKISGKNIIFPDAAYVFNHDYLRIEIDGALDAKKLKNIDDRSLVTRLDYGDNNFLFLSEATTHFYNNLIEGKYSSILRYTSQVVSVYYKKSLFENPSCVMKGHPDISKMFEPQYLMISSTNESANSQFGELFNTKNVINTSSSGNITFTANGVDLQLSKSK